MRDGRDERERRDTHRGDARRGSLFSLPSPHPCSSFRVHRSSFPPVPSSSPDTQVPPFSPVSRGSRFTFPARSSPLVSRFSYLVIRRSSFTLRNPPVRNEIRIPLHEIRFPRYASRFPPVPPFTPFPLVPRLSPYPPFIVQRSSLIVQPPPPRFIVHPSSLIVPRSSFSLPPVPPFTPFPLALPVTQHFRGP